MEAGEDFSFAEFADELPRPPLAQRVGAELAADVAQHEFWGAAVGADQPLDVAVAAIGRLVAHGGQVQPLVEDFPRLARAASRYRAADVALVRDRAAEAEQLAVREERRKDGKAGRDGPAAPEGRIDHED